MNRKTTKSLSISLLILVSLTFASCSIKDKVNSNNPLVVLDMETLLDNQEEVKLSDIAESIRYVSLETNLEAQCQTLQYIIRGEKIFIRNKNQTVFLFDGDGNFVRQIGRIGQGPGEYAGMDYMDVSADGDLVYYYYTRQNVGYVFSSEGDKISKFELKYPSWRFAALSVDRHVMISPYGAMSPDSEPFLFYILEGEGKVTRVFPSSKVIAMGGNFGLGKFVSTPKGVLGFHALNDTVYSFSPEGRRTPKYVLNYGDKRLPNEEHDDMMKLYDNRDRYFYSPSLHETANQLFVRVNYNKKSWLGIWQHKNHSLTPIRSDNGTIENNLDGGIDFWPAASDGDHTVYRLLKAIDLLEARNNEDFQGKDFKSEKDRSNFTDMLDNLQENDNPVIMFVKLK